MGQKECLARKLRVGPTCWVWKGAGEGNGWKAQSSLDPSPFLISANETTFSSQSYGDLRY